MFNSQMIKKAWSIRKAAASKYNCRVMEIVWRDCLMMAKEENVEYTYNKDGYVQFENRKWDYKADKGSWARYEFDKDGNKVAVKVKVARHGLLSREYEAELEQFCNDHGIDWSGIKGGRDARVNL